MEYNRQQRNMSPILRDVSAAPVHAKIFLLLELMTMIFLLVVIILWQGPGNKDPKMVSQEETRMHLLEQIAGKTERLNAAARFEDLKFSNQSGKTVISHRYEIQTKQPSNVTIYRHYISTTSAPSQHKKRNLSEEENVMCQPLRFYTEEESRDLPLTALHSFPGSGSTWLRHLLHQATGIYTGSKYNATILLKVSEFSGEIRADSSVIGVKTHGRADQRYTRAVLLFRNPRDAILAEFRRRTVGKLGSMKRESYLTSRWRDFVVGHMYTYKTKYLSWINWDNPDKYVVFYEDLKTNLIPTLSGLVKYLTGKTIPPSIAECVKKNSEGLFHGKSTDTFDPYSVIPNERDALMAMKEEVFAQIRSCIRSKNCQSSTSDDVGM